MIGIVITLFGVRTLGDIRRDLVSTAKKAFADRLSNPTSFEFQTLEGILDRAVVDSYLLQLSRQRAQRDRFRQRVEVVLEASDRARLFKLLRSPEVDQARFQDVVRVLVEASGDRQWSRISPVLVDLVMAKPPDFDWFKAEPERRAFVLRHLGKKHSDAFVGLRDLLVDRALPKELRLAAVGYAAEVGAASYTGELEAVASEGDRDLERAAMESVVTINPRSPQVERWVRLQLDTPMDLAAVARLLRIARIVIAKNRGPMSFEDDEDRPFRADLAKRIWRSVASKSDAIIVKDSMPFAEDERRLNLLITQAKSPRGGRVVPADTVFGQMERILEELLAEAAQRPTLVDFRQLLRLLGAVEEAESLVAVGARLAGVASVKLDDNTVITKDNAPGGIGVRLPHEAKDRMLIRWTDVSGGNRIGTVVAFAHADDITFRIRSTQSDVTPVEDDD